MFMKIGGKAFGYATLLAVFFSLATCGPGPGSSNSGTNGSTTDGGGGQRSSLVIVDLQAANVTDTVADVQGTLIGTWFGTNIGAYHEDKSAKIEVVCTDNHGWTSTKLTTPEKTDGLTHAWVIHFDGLVDETDYDVSATAIDTDINSSRGETKKITFHTKKLDPEWELAKTVFNGSTWRTADYNDQNTLPIRTTRLSETTDPNCSTGRQVIITQNYGGSSYCFDQKMWNAWAEGDGYRVDYKADFCENARLIEHYGEQARAITEANASTADGCYDQWNQLRDAEFIWRVTEVNAGTTNKTDLLKLPN